MNALRTAALAALLAVSACLHAYAQPQQCLPQAATLAAQLGEQWGEALAGAGVDAVGNMVSLYSNPSSGTWTIAVTLPGGPPASSARATAGPRNARRLLQSSPNPHQRRANGRRYRAPGAVQPSRIRADPWSAPSQRRRRHA